MLYLSKLDIATDYPQVMKDIANMNGLHKRLMAAFPNGYTEARKDMNILFRVETNAGRVVIYVQSGVEPAWEQLDVRSFAAPPLSKNIGPTITNLKAGQLCSFRLRANPTKRISNGTNASKRLGLLREDDQISWLHKKASTGGFELVAVKVSPEGFLKTKDHKTFLSVLFDGTLKIVDPECFVNTLQKGVGAGKAYGFGLMSLAPVKST